MLLVLVNGSVKIYMKILVFIFFAIVAYIETTEPQGPFAFILKQRSHMAFCVYIEKEENGDF